MSYFILAEALRSYEVILMICSFGGILMMAIASLQTYDDSGNDTYFFGILFAIIFAMVASLIGVLVRMLQNLHFGIVLFYYNTLAITVIGLGLLVEWAVTKKFRLFTYEASQYGQLVLAAFINSIGL